MGGTRLREPLVDCVPDHAPLALQDDTLVVDHCSVTDCWTATEEALALRVRVAVGVGETPVWLDDEPPLPPPPHEARTMANVARSHARVSPMCLRTPVGRRILDAFRVALLQELFFFGRRKT